MSNKIEKLEYLIRQCESIQVQIHDDDVDFKDYLLMRVIQMRIEFERQLSLANNEHKKLEQSYWPDDYFQSTHAQRDEELHWSRYSHPRGKVSSLL